VGGGSVIEPVAVKHRAHGLEQLAVHESGSLEARLLQRLARETKPASSAVLAQAVSEPEASAAEALARLAVEGEVIPAAEGRWLAPERWNGARHAIEREVRAYAAKYPARYGVMKGELKSGLKAAMETALFDTAYLSLVEDGVLEQRGEHVRPADTPWEPPAATMALLERAEAELEAKGFLVPEAQQWQAKLGADAQEVVTLGLFLGRLVRVTQELFYTARQLEDLRAKLASYFSIRPSLTVGDFRDTTGASRKYAVPLLEHCDRVGWTVRVGDARKAGARLA
jgi:selenocysteine-specific elongation factor